jgi:putative transposase
MSSKKALKPADKRDLVGILQGEHGLSVRRACKTVRLSRSVYHYKPDLANDEPVIEALVSLADRYPRYGFGKLFLLMCRQGNPWNHKRVYRVYCSLKLNFRRKGKKRLPSRSPQPLAVPTDANKCWSIDFMSDVLTSGQRFRTFNRAVGSLLAIFLINTIS